MSHLYPFCIEVCQKNESQSLAFHFQLYFLWNLKRIAVYSNGYFVATIQKKTSNKFLIHLMVFLRPRRIHGVNDNKNVPLPPSMAALAIAKAKHKSIFPTVNR